MKCQINMANLVYVASSPKCSWKNVYDDARQYSVDFICGLNITFNSNAIYCFLFCILSLLRNKCRLKNEINII